MSEQSPGKTSFRQSQEYRQRQRRWGLISALICLKKKEGGGEGRQGTIRTLQGMGSQKPDHQYEVCIWKRQLKGLWQGEKWQGISPSSNIQLGYTRKACSQAHSGWWLNSAPWSCRPEGPVSLLAFSQGFILAPGGCLQSSCFLCAFSCNRRAALMSHIFSDLVLQRRKFSTF